MRKISYSNTEYKYSDPDYKAKGGDRLIKDPDYDSLITYPLISVALLPSPPLLDPCRTSDLYQLPTISRSLLRSSPVTYDLHPSPTISASHLRSPPVTYDLCLSPTTISTNFFKVLWTELGLSRPRRRPARPLWEGHDSWEDSHVTSVWEAGQTSQAGPLTAPVKPYCTLSS